MKLDTNKRDTNLIQKHLNQKPVKVFLVCSGLGNIQRGYESFTRECFDALSNVDSLDIKLFKGGGKSDKNEMVLWNLPRQSNATKQISKLVGWLTHKEPNPYFTEQFSFCISLLLYIYWERPEVIYFSDESLGDLLWHWRRLTNINYKLLFRNGGPTSRWKNIVRWDHVQQLVPVHLQSALNIGLPLERQSLLLPGFNLPSEPILLTAQEREALRHKLGLPEKRSLLLSVAAIDKSRKRIDYIIRELAVLPEPRPYLVCLGQQTEETPEIIRLGHDLLGAENFSIRTVPYHEVKDYYKISDAFVLASLIEGFGRVFVEALSYGLPCLAHRYEVSDFVLGQEGYFADFTLPGSLAGLIPQALSESNDLSKRHSRYQRAYNNFSWQALTPSYVELIYRCKDSVPSYRKAAEELIPN